MREAWFEIIKGARDRKGVSEAYKRSSKKKLDERIAAEKELDNRRGKKGSILDEKGRKTLQDVKDLTSEEKRKDSKAMNQSRKEGFSQGVKNILGRGKKAGQKALSYLSPNSYLPDPSATGTGKVDLRAKDPFSGKPRFENIKRLTEGKESVKDEKARLAGEATDTAGFKDQMGQFQQQASSEQEASALAAQQESERKKNLRTSMAQGAAESQRDSNQAAKDEEIRADKARQELMAQQQLQAKDTRDAKIKEMGEANRQKAEAARAKANTTIMPELTGLQTKPAPSVNYPTTLSDGNTLDIQGSKQQPPPPPRKKNPPLHPNEIRDAKLRRAYLKQGEAQTEAANYKPEQPKQNPNMPPKPVPANAPPPKQQNPNAPTQPKTVVNPPPPPPPQQQYYQPTQQQRASQFKAGDSPLQPQSAKQSAWQKVLQKPAAKPQNTKVAIQ